MTTASYLLDALPDPDDVGQSEYRAVHELLTDALEGLEEGESAKPLALAALQNMESWCSLLYTEIKFGGITHPLRIVVARVKDCPQ